MLNTIGKNQMELGFEKEAIALAEVQQRKAAKQAQWWFQQMRRVVDMAMEWKPTPEARPEQVYLSWSAKRS